MKAIILYIIRIYQSFSHIGLPRCRYYPSCSQYTYESIEKYGIFLGIWLGLKRILRCHPFCEGGYDPLPKNLNKRMLPNLNIGE